MARERKRKKQRASAAAAAPVVEVMPPFDRRPPGQPPSAGEKLPPRLLRYEVMYHDLKAHGVDPDQAPVRSESGPPVALGPWPAEGLKRIPDSLPVLQAFQDFLDVERARTRNKLLALGALFLLLILTVAGLSAFFVQFYYHRASRDITDVRQDLVSARGESRAANAELFGALASYSQQTHRVGQDIADKLSSLQELRTSFEARTNVYEQDLENVRHSVSALAQDNANLRKTIDDLLATWRSPAPPAAKAPARKTLLIPITPPAGQEAVLFRVPLPE